jgi:hypothetical protein
MCGTRVFPEDSRKRGKGVLDYQVGEIVKGKRKYIPMVDIVDFVNEMSPEFRPACARSIRATPSWTKYHERIAK